MNPVSLAISTTAFIGWFIVTTGRPQALASRAAIPKLSSGGKNKNLCAFQRRYQIPIVHKASKLDIFGS